MNSQIKKIWQKTKRLSGLLEHEKERDYPRDSMAKICHLIQADLALLVAELEKWDVKSLDELRENGIIDDYDYGYFKRVLS